MRKVFLGLIILAAAVTFSSPCFAEEQQQAQGPQVKYVNGKVASIDLFNKEITVNVADKEGKAEQLKFVIDQHTKIFRKDLVLGLTDMRQGDEVIIEYVSDPMSFSSNKASRIRVKAADEGKSSY